MSEDRKHVYQVRIAVPPEKVWRALTDSDYTTRFWYGAAVRSDWQAGSDYTMTAPDGSVIIHGRVLEADPPRRLVQTYNSAFPPFDAEQETTITWELEPDDEGTRLTLTHAGFQAGSVMYETIKGKAGWPHIVDSLKKLLESE